MPLNLPVPVTATASRPRHARAHLLEDREEVRVTLNRSAGEAGNRHGAADQRRGRGK